jgi:hypothetical protein
MRKELMASSIMEAWIRIVAIALVPVLAAAGARPCGAGEDKQIIESSATRTGKERLGGKSSDEQRVDNCKVPPELRGPKPRPDQCRAGADPDPTR